ncbi:MAG: nucleotide kinase domain-containing protein [Thermoguttaceae bacterium]|jgi:NTP pyrophosphatase (non-canonical NTP hydrolase)
MPSRVARDDSKLFPAEEEFSAQLTAPPPRIAPLKPTLVYDTYWWFAAERQRIFFCRLSGQAAPWTDDPVIRAYKFTNAYRASDRVSQYLIRRVIYRDDLPDDPVEVTFRVLLFKLFNRIETWELLERSLGPITYAGYAFKHYDQVLTRAMMRGKTIYSAAYIMPAGGSLGHKRKHRNHLTLLGRMMSDELPIQLTEARSMQGAFDLIRAYPTVGDFLGYQYVTDINYSRVTDFTEMEFVIPGPGAIDGIRKCFSDTGGLNDAEVIRFMADRQEIEFARLGLQFQSLWGRRLQLIDCQNLFCEVNKYARVRHPEIGGVSGRTRIKQKFRPLPDQISYWYPPKWKINDAVVAGQASSTTAATSTLSITRPEDGMDFNTYQERATKTDRNPGTGKKGMMIPLLGLAGEAGQVLSEYKKYLRDGESHTLFKERFAEELGDLLWYLANAATKFGLSLAELAEQNLAKCEDRWGSLPDRAPFDTGFPDGQRFPRKFLVDFNTFHHENEVSRVRVMYKGKPFGDELTDNAYVKDGYGYHDALHLSFAAVLGWSPLTRKLLGVKRRDDNRLDLVERVEDGGRAIATEEGLATMIFAYARDYNWLEGKSSVSTELLRMVENMTTHLEVSVCTPGEWEQAIVQGFAVWREIKKCGDGTLVVNLDDRSIRIKDK